MAAADEPGGSGRRVRGRLLGGLLALVAALVVGGGVAAARGDLGRSAAPATPEMPTATATVTRTDVVERQQVSGTLGYDGSYPVVGTQSAGGVLTRLPTPGTVIGRGQPLYEVDGRRVPLWFGSRPAWRAFALGMADGPDVRQLEANLVALGHDRERSITVDGHFTPATAAAVKRWQRAAGLSRTGAIPFGQVVFLPGPVRVAAVAATAGAPVQPGSPILTATSTRPVVSVALNTAFQQLVRRGNRVLVTLPDGATTRGTVTAVSRAAVPGSSGGGQGGGSEGGGGNGDGSEQATVSVTVALADPRAVSGLDQAPVQVAITTQAHRGVLAVPISGLLAGTGGGYAVEVVEGSARRRLPVTPGLFDETAGLVEVAGTGLVPGAKVAVPADGQGPP